MSGAAILSGFGALRSGIGLLTLAVPRSVAPIVAQRQPAWMTLPLDDTYDDQGYRTVSSGALATIKKKLSTLDALAIGPGLGRSTSVQDVVVETFKVSECPIVIDADGLRAIEDNVEVLKERKGRSTILTPHASEFASLCGCSISEVQNNREKLAAEFAQEHELVLLLKGPGTVITDGHRIAINRTGNSGLASGGSGDVLTGIVTALVAQAMDPFEAAQLAAHVHGLSGDHAKKDLGERFMCSSDLPNYLKNAWHQLETS